MYCCVGDSPSLYTQLRVPSRYVTLPLATRTRRRQEQQINKPQPAIPSKKRKTKHLVTHTLSPKLISTRNQATKKTLTTSCAAAVYRSATLTRYSYETQTCRSRRFLGKREPARASSWTTLWGKDTSGIFVAVEETSFETAATVPRSIS